MKVFREVFGMRGITVRARIHVTAVTAAGGVRWEI